MDTFGSVSAFEDTYTYRLCAATAALMHIRQTTYPEWIDAKLKESRLPAFSTAQTSKLSLMEMVCNDVSPRTIEGKLEYAMDSVRRGDISALSHMYRIHLDAPHLDYAIDPDEDIKRIGTESYPYLRTVAFRPGDRLLVSSADNTTPSWEVMLPSYENVSKILASKGY